MIWSANRLVTARNRSRIHASLRAGVITTTRTGSGGDTVLRYDGPSETEGREGFATPEPVSHTGAMNLAGFRAVCDDAWRLVNGTPGFPREREARFRTLAAAAAPADGAIVGIGSFKGRSTVGLASVARRYAVAS